MRSVHIVRSWCGIEAETPDRLPILDFSPSAPGVIHVFGFSGHGFQLGPICGVAVADLATRGATDLPIAPFAANRFATANPAAVTNLNAAAA
jgi:sarcosine oxidase subunit beta